MIDYIQLVKRKLTASELQRILDNNRLIEKSSDGCVYYASHRHSKQENNLSNGIDLTIDVNRKLSIKGSLHKYKSYLESGKHTSYDSFTMKEAQETLNKLIDKIGIPLKGCFVNYYEVGMNINTLDESPFDILKEVYSIGTDQRERLFYYNPSYKERHIKTTQNCKDKRIVFTMYDKAIETKTKLKDEKFKALNNILRIETKNKKPEKLELSIFKTSSYLNMIQTKFFHDWELLRFNKDIEAPKGTRKGTLEVAKEIIYSSPIEVLNKYRLQYENNTLTKDTFYRIKKFCDDWNNVKTYYTLIDKKIFGKTRKSYEIEKQKHTAI